MSTKTANSKTLAIKWAVNILLPLIFFFIPTTDVFTLQMKLFFATTIFAICCFAMETLDTTAVSIILPVAWVFLDGGKISDKLCDVLCAFNSVV